MDVKRNGTQPSGKGPDEYFTAMTLIAILEHLIGKTVDWMEKVSDEQYQTACQNKI